MRIRKSFTPYLLLILLNSLNVAAQPVSDCGSVIGRVVDERYRPLEGVRVYGFPHAHGMEPDWQERRGELLGFTRLDGRFMIPLEPDGSWWQLQVEADGYHRQSFTIVAPHCSPLKVRMELAGCLEGRVIDAEGRAVPDSSVLLVPRDLTGWSRISFPGKETKTNSEGTFRFDSARAGKFRVRSNDPRMILDHGVETEILGGPCRQIVVPVRRGIRVPVRVRWADGSPVKDADFALVPFRLGELDVGPCMNSLQGSHPEGHFLLPASAPGVRDILMVCNNYTASAFSYSFTVEVRENLQPVEIRLPVSSKPPKSPKLLETPEERQERIARIARGLGDPPLVFRPHRPVVFEVYDRGQPLEGMGVSLGKARDETDAQGRAELRIPEGESGPFRLWVYGPRQNFALYLEDVKIDPAAKQPVRIDVKNGQLRGTVRDAATGEPVRQVGIFLCSDYGPDTVCIGWPDRRVYSDGEGRFEFDRLPAQSWWLVAYRPGYGIHRQLLKTHYESPVELDLELTPTPGLILQLIAGLPGADLPTFVTVRFYNAQGTMVAGEGASRLAGNRVRLYSAPVGRWQIRIEGQDAEGAEWIGRVDGVAVPGPALIVFLSKVELPE